MLHSLFTYLSENSAHAHWFIFVGLLLAGFNIPISIDVLVILAALLAAKFVPENLYLLYTMLLTGSLISAWISYTLGRTLGLKLAKWKLFRPFFSDRRIDKLKNFYDRYGTLTFILGRFIPFGIRNCLFMSSGLSKMPFLRFALQDFLACFIWVTSFFTIFYQLGQNFEVIWGYVKTFNLLIFLTFTVAVISVFWYKHVKKLNALQLRNSQDNYNP